MSEPRSTHAITIAGVPRELPLFEVAPGITIAILNILGDTELVQAAAAELAARLPASDYDVLVTAEAKSIPLAHALSVSTGKPYIILRKTYKPYMGAALSAETVSITTAATQTLYLDEKDLATVQGRRVALVDDVVSTGSTQKGMQALMLKAGAEVTLEAAILTEGDPAQWGHVLALGHLPVWTDS